MDCYFKDVEFWTSGNDIETEGLWVWGSTNETLYPGYANRYSGEPNDCSQLDRDEDCLMMGAAHSNECKDDECSVPMYAICEAHP